MTDFGEFIEEVGIITICLPFILCCIITLPITLPIWLGFKLYKRVFEQ